MSDRNRGVFDRLMSRGEEFFTQVSNELMMNPRFIQAMQTAMRGKETVDFAVSQALKSMSVPTRNEFKRLQGRLESMENEVRDLRDEVRLTRAQAARASAAARTATTKGKTVGTPAKVPAAATPKARRPASKPAKKKAARRATAPATPVVVSGDGTTGE